MTIQETIDQLNRVPVERRGEKLRVYLKGRISGYLETRRIRLDDDEDYICIDADLNRPED